MILVDTSSVVFAFSVCLLLLFLRMIKSANFRLIASGSLILIKINGYYITKDSLVLIWMVESFNCGMALITF